MKSMIHPAYLGFPLGKDWYAQVSGDTRAINPDWYKFIKKILKIMPEMNSIDTQQLLSSAYEIEYDIFQHVQKRKHRPLSLVAMHDSENINDGSLLENIIRGYTLKSIKDHFGISLSEYLDMPTDVVDMLNTIADEHNQRKSSIVDGIQQTLSKAEKI